MPLSRPPKGKLVEELMEEFRLQGNRDRAFDNLAAEQLGVNDTDQHCLNIIEAAGGLTAGELAEAAGLSTGAVTGVVDRLERAGYARRIRDSADRRRINIEVTPEFYARAQEIWGPLARDFQDVLTNGFTAAELERIIEFLRATDEVASRHIDRLRAAADRRP
jgi:DNA-binding MarR family transcriptional regulator